MAKASKSKKSPALSPGVKKDSTGSGKKNTPDTENGLLDLFVDGIKDIYWAEKHLTKAIPKMIRSSSSKELANALTEHLEVTKTQAVRLEKVFDLLGEKIQAKKCDAMEGLSKEGEGIIENTDPGTEARDLGIIMASQKVEHYEIASYTGLSKLAGKLGFPEVADLLNQNLNEEIDADNKLGAIADNK